MTAQPSEGRGGGSSTPRRIDVTVPREKAERLLERLPELDGIVGISHQPDGSTQPPGDRIIVVCTNDAEIDVFRVLAEEHVSDVGSAQSTELRFAIDQPNRTLLADEDSEPPWEETGTFLRKETNAGPNFFILMALCGSIAAVGLWNDTIHVVIGAMILAPGFHPILRIPFAYLSGPRDHLRQGLVSTVGGYATLAASAALTLVVLAATEPGMASDIAGRGWVRFFSTTDPASTVLAIVAGVGGVVTVTADRPVLTAAVMVALALIPAMAIFGMALAIGDVSLAAAALARWSVDVAAILVAGAAVLGLKRRVVHQRPAIG